MSPKHIYTAVGILALALIGGMALHAYIGSERDVTRAETIKSDVQKQIADLRGDLKDTLEAIRKDRELKTPAQIVQRLPEYVPLPKPIYIQPPLTVASSGPQSFPDAPSMIIDPHGTTPAGSLVIPAESVGAFWEHETGCKEDAAKLGACQKEVPLLTQRAEAAEQAMKGGSRWSKFKSAGKWFVIGAASGAAAYGISHR